LSDSPSEITSLDASSRASVSLLRALGPATAIALVVGNVIGSGIFAKPGTIAAQGASFGLIISVWIFGGVLCLLGTLCFAELAALFPKAGGPYVYLREAYGRGVAFLFGWNEVLFNRPGGIGALGTFFLTSLLAALHWKAGVWTQIGLISALILVIAWVNVLGVIWGGRLQNLTTVIKAGGVAFVAAAPFVLQALTGSGIDWGNYSSALWVSPQAAAAENVTDWLSRFGIILLAVMWAYHGWSSVTPVAEEIRNPQRNVPLALVAGISIVTVLYVSANVAYHGVLSMNELAEAGNDGAYAACTKFTQPLGGWGGTLITAVILCSTFGAINSNLLVTPRVAYAMGRDGEFFPALGQVHVIYRTPAVAIVAQAVMAIALLVASGLATQWAGLAKDKSVFTLLTNFVVFASAVFEGLCVLGLFLLRRKHADVPRPYRVPGYPLVPLAFLLSFAAFLLLVFLSAPLEAVAGLVLVGLGLPVHLWWRRRSRAGERPASAG
jgi:APA family basic amino acid/polyamine antiporter